MTATVGAGLAVKASVRDALLRAGWEVAAAREALRDAVMLVPTELAGAWFGPAGGALLARCGLLLRAVADAESLLGELAEAIAAAERG